MCSFVVTMCIWHVFNKLLTYLLTCACEWRSSVSLTRPSSSTTLCQSSPVWMTLGSSTSHPAASLAPTVRTAQSWPWVGLTHGHRLGWVGNGSRIFVFSGLGWVMGLKWQICEKQMSCTHVTLYCQAIGMGWVGSWVHKFTWQWVGLGWISYLVGWVGFGSMK